MLTPFSHFSPLLCAGSNEYLPDLSISKIPEEHLNVLMRLWFYLMMGTVGNCKSDFFLSRNWFTLYDTCAVLMFYLYFACIVVNVVCMSAGVFTGPR